MKALYQFANNLASISEEAFELITPFLTPINYDENTIICDIGDDAKYLYFIKSGVVRTSTISDSGKTFTRALYSENEFFGPLSNIIKNERSSFIYEALTDCQLIRSEHKKVQELYEKHPELMRFELKVFEHVYVKMEKTIINLGTKNAKERYQKLLIRFKGIENLIPQYQIASYLGITPIQLSRIRKSISETNI